MEKGHLTFELKSKILKQLKPIVSDSYCQKSNHGDLKVILLLYLLKTTQLYYLKPENILVDYDYVDGTVINFKMVIADWGMAWFRYLTERIGNNKSEFLGGTPGYAGPHTFNQSGPRDLFSFARLALDLALDKKGKSCSFY